MKKCSKKIESSPDENCHLSLSVAMKDYNGRWVGIRISNDERECWVITQNPNGDWQLRSPAFPTSEIPETDIGQGPLSFLQLALALIAHENGPARGELRDIGIRSRGE